MILGIDYGRSNIGLAISAGELADPLRVITNDGSMVVLLQKIIGDYAITQIVVGISSGAMGHETREWAQTLNSILALSLEFSDETLTSRESQGDHAKAAAVMLQRYLDEKRVKSKW